MHFSFRTSNKELVNAFYDFHQKIFTKSTESRIEVIQVGLEYYVQFETESELFPLQENKIYYQGACLELVQEMPKMLGDDALLQTCSQNEEEKKEDLETLIKLIQSLANEPEIKHSIISEAERSSKIEDDDELGRLTLVEQNIAQRKEKTSQNQFFKSSPSTYHFEGANFHRFREAVIKAPHNIDESAFDENTGIFTIPRNSPFSTETLEISGKSIAVLRYHDNNHAVNIAENGTLNQEFNRVHSIVSLVTPQKKQSNSFDINNQELCQSILKEVQTALSLYCENRRNKGNYTGCTASIFGLTHRNWESKNNLIQAIQEGTNIQTVNVDARKGTNLRKVLIDGFNNAARKNSIHSVKHSLQVIKIIQKIYKNYPNINQQSKNSILL